MPAVLGADREGGGRLVQPHGVLRVRRRVLLALYEGGVRFALPQVSTRVIVSLYIKLFLFMFSFLTYVICSILSKK